LTASRTFPLSFSIDHVRSLARLARLDLRDEELERLTPQLATLVAYFDLLQEVDTSTVEPFEHVGNASNALRDDEPTPVLSVEDALANAPARRDDVFRVPPVL
jgi:aspartyl-tRNA(Asn)/glutamyl-tRNA(Gln) amidotransferase subunit C